ncbi:unnamed protein product [Phytomonas sp. EM1]|nr:unnamed protein product [Phytomonas sp. EM1]|eukprot:CCW63445.1 unnamed protein product [Phytomonas sp. isolate EM1]
MEATSFVPLHSPKGLSTPVVRTVDHLPTPSHPATDLKDGSRQLDSGGGIESEDLSISTPVGSSPDPKGQPDLAHKKDHHKKKLEEGTIHSTSSGSMSQLSRRNCDASSSQFGRFTSKKVRLPSTVDDLISSYEVLYERHEAQKTLLDTFYKEMNRLVEGCPYFASTALKDVLRIASKSPQVAAEKRQEDGAPPVIPALATTRTLSAGRTPALHSEGNEGPVGGGVVCGKVVPSRATPASSIKGNVVGTVLAPPRDVSKLSEAANERSVSSQMAATRAGADAMPEEAERECAVLRAKVLALEAAEQLLASSRVEVQQLVQERDRLEADLMEAHERFHKVEEENVALRSAFQTDQIHANDLATLGEEQTQHLMALLQASASSEQNLKEKLKSRRESIDRLEYHVSQLKAQLGSLQTQNSFLNERSAQLEGQLRRLLSDDAMREMKPKSSSAFVKPNQDGPNPSIAVGGGKGGQPSPNAVEQLTPLQRYNTDTFQRQINELRTIVDRLHKSNTQHEAARAKLESQLVVLSKENTTLKRDVLEYRRRVSDMELNLENEASLRSYEERCRSAEKEAMRLRQVLRERTESFDGRMSEVQQRLNLLQTRDKLYAKATKHLLTRCVSSTIQLLACQELSKQRREIRPLGVGVAGDAPQVLGAHPTTKTREKGEEGEEELTKTGREDGSGQRDDASGVKQSSVMTGEGLLLSAPVLESFASPRPMGSEPLGARGGGEPSTEAASTGSRMEIRRLEQLNRELRQALARSQEELLTKARLLTRAQRTASNTSLGVNASYQALTLRRDPSALTELSSTVGSLDASVNGPLRRDASVGCDLPPPGRNEQESIAEASRVLSEIKVRYDPEHLDTCEAVQLENAALLLRLSILQQEKWAAASQIEALQSNCAELSEKLRRVMSSSKGLPPTDAAAGQLRGLQSLLQETLADKLKLEEKIKKMALPNPE